MGLVRAAAGAACQLICGAKNSCRYLLVGFNYRVLRKDSSAAPNFTIDAKEEECKM
jgi:hypothetical protein